MSQVNVDAEQVRKFVTALKLYAENTSEILGNIRVIYTQLDNEWDDDSKNEYIDSINKTCAVLNNVSESLTETSYDLTELASIIERYANE